MADDRPNVILVMTDQQKTASMPLYGNPVVKMPNLGRLAAGGVVFENAFTPYPVCVPSRVMTFNGRYAHTNRAWSNHVLMPLEDEHLLKVFQREGYQTGFSGKNHCFLPEDLRRFDSVWECGHGGPKTPPDEAAAAAKQFLVDSKIHLRTWGTETNPHPPESLGTALTVSHAIEFLENRAPGRPFFLWCSIADPHTPVQTAEPYASMYDPASVPVPEQREGEMDAKPVAQQIDWRAVAGDQVTEADIRRVTAMYYGMNTYIDHELGRLLDSVESLGLREQTLVVYMSDHGEYLGEHGMIRKSKALYDCLIHVPMVVSWPGRLPEGRREEAFVEVVDVAPSILDAMGVPQYEGIQGRSFLPLLRGEAYEARDAVFAEHGVPAPGGRIASLADLKVVPEGPDSPDFSPGLKLGGRGPIKCVRTREWKLVYYPGNEEGELYRLTEDPGELVNLWGRPEYARLTAQLTARILDWCIETEDHRLPDGARPGTPA